MLLIRTLLDDPGVGQPAQPLAERGDRGANADRTTHHQAIAPLRDRLRHIAADHGQTWPESYPSVATLNKDLGYLREWGILERRMYRWGYYLGTGVMKKPELKAALDALRSQAHNQGDPTIRQIYAALEQRLRGFEWGQTLPPSYPVRQIFNRAIHWTDPTLMMERGARRDTLFHQITVLETAIAQGQAIEISLRVDRYQGDNVGMIALWPLQLLYYDIAWYLVHEACQDGCFGITRMDRLGNYCRVLTLSGRGMAAQAQSLQEVYQLLDQGWGLKLGNRDEQRAELAGSLPLEQARVRFFPPIAAFIAEGETRHPRQVMHWHQDKQHLDYEVALPPRSLDEFGIWVQRYASHAQVLGPDLLVARHRQIAYDLAKRYGHL